MFLGEELGGRPKSPELYFDGKVNYKAIRQTQMFQAGIDKVIDLINFGIKVTLMCSESDQNDCALAKVLNCSIGQAFNLKKLAKSIGYIKVKKGFISTGFSIKDIDGFKKGYPELSSKLVRKKDQIVLKSSDLVKSNMPLSRREKIWIIYKGFKGVTDGGFADYCE